MPSTKIERKLAAIMFTDIVGYTEQMAKDQDFAFVLLEEKQSKFKPLIKQHNGSLIKEMGDGTLSQYPTAVDASRCSVQLQELIKNNNKLNVRVGIHLGDTLFKDGDVFGDGVNIASRLESMAPPGGILVSKNVYDELLSRKGFEGISLGLQSLKGVGRLIEVYALKDEHLVTPNPDEYKSTTVETHTDEEVPSLAIIPFKNKGSEKDIFYAYGISSDLISDCSSAGRIRVASLSDIEKIDYDKLNNIELSKKLLARYIVHGTLWKMGEMFQLTVELYDAKNAKVIWSDRWQEKWDNLIEIKSNLSESLLNTFESNKKKEKVQTLNVDAYKKYLEGNYRLGKNKSIDDVKLTLDLFLSAIKLDKNFIEAYHAASLCYHKQGDDEKATEYLFRGKRLAKAENNKSALLINFFQRAQYAFYSGYYNNCEHYYIKAIEFSIETNNSIMEANSRNNYSTVLAKLNKISESVKQVEMAIKIKEELGDTRNLGASYGQISMNKIALFNNYSEGIKYASKALDLFIEFNQNRNVGKIYLILAESYKNLGHYELMNEYCKKSESIAKPLNDYVVLGNIYLFYGYYKISLEKYNDALIYLDKAIEIFKNQPRFYLIVEILVEKLKLYIQMEEFVQTKLIFEQLINKEDDIEQSKFKFTFNSIKLLMEHVLNKKKIYISDELKNEILELNTEDSMFSNWYLARYFGLINDKDNLKLHHEKAKNILKYLCSNNNKKDAQLMLNNNYYNVLIQKNIKINNPTNNIETKSKASKPFLFCPECGFNNKGEFKFCPECGQKLN